MDGDSILPSESAFDPNGYKDIFKVKENRELIENMAMAVYSSTFTLPVIAFEKELKHDLRY
jgi:hypothetical protein